MSSGRQIAAALAAVAVAAVVAVVVLGGDGGDSNETTTPDGTTRETAKQPKHDAGRIKRRGKRQAVRRGHGTQPDQPAPGTGALLAIADQKPETFGDPTFRRLGPARTRLNTPWNSIFKEPARLWAWLNAARSAGLEPLVAFEHARGDACPAKPCSLPPVAAYERAVRAFHERYPWVHLLQPWNEANSATQPTGKHPERAAAYYEAVRRVCRDCVVPAADVLDGSNTERWVKAFKAALSGPLPQLWGLHNYGDVNHFRASGTKRFLGLVPGEVWMTETGGIVSFTTSDGRVAFPPDPQRAARATRFMFRLADRFPRIKRIYIYQWKIDFPGNRFDAGLVDENGRPRPALRVVEGRRALLR
jgi:hypothetical protein